MSPSHWNRRERIVFSHLRDPGEIQALLDELPYLPEGGAHSPRTTLALGRAQCFGGAVLAAAALSELGQRPLLVNLRAVNDDDHVLAVFRQSGYWGAVGKSNFTTLRHREPVYRTLRELVMSYFDFYFNADGEKTLRAFSVTLDLSRHEYLGWRTSHERLWKVEEDIERLRHTTIVPAALDGKLLKVSPQVLEAGLIGSVEEGLYRPDHSSSAE